MPAAIFGTKIVAVGKYRFHLSESAASASGFTIGDRFFPDRPPDGDLS
jgi:hypothetical protein